MLYRMSNPGIHPVQPREVPQLLGAGDSGIRTDWSKPDTPPRVCEVMGERQPTSNARWQRGLLQIAGSRRYAGSRGAGVRRSCFPSVSRNFGWSVHGNGPARKKETHDPSSLGVPLVRREVQGGGDMGEQHPFPFRPLPRLLGGLRQGMAQEEGSRPGAQVQGYPALTPRPVTHDTLPLSGVQA